MSEFAELPWWLTELLELKKENEELRGKVAALEEDLKMPYCKAWSIIAWCPECGPLPEWDPEDNSCRKCGCVVGDIPDFRALEAEIERLKDLVDRVCEECADGEERYRDPVFGIYKHSVSGVYGCNAVSCGFNKRK